MPKCECPCGARYKVADSAVGHKSKCKKCGRVFVLSPVAAGEGIAVAADSGISPPILASQPAVESTEFDPGRDYLRAHASLGEVEGVSARDFQRFSRFVAAVSWSLLFPSLPRNLLTFGVVFGVLLLVTIFSAIPVLGWLLFGAIFVTWGWYSGYRFSIIESAAGGETDLPGLAVSTSWFDEVVIPTFKWMGSWALALIPAAAYAIYLAWSGSPIPMPPRNVWTSGLSGYLQLAADMPVMTALILGGLALWPMIILCIAIDGFTAALRFDLMLLTIVRAFSGYFVMILMVAAAVAAQYLVNWGLENLLAQTPSNSLSVLLTRRVVLHATAALLILYFEIILLQAIGFFYHFFKSDFPQAWG